MGRGFTGSDDGEGEGWDLELELALGGDVLGTWRVGSWFEGKMGSAADVVFCFRGDTLRARLRRGDSVWRSICQEAIRSLAGCVDVLSRRERVVREETMLEGRVLRIDPVRRESRLTASQLSARTRF